MIPGEHNWSIVRGATSPFVFRLQASDESPIPFTDVRLSIYKGNTLLIRKSTATSDVDVPVNGGMIVTDAETGEITWTPTPAESRLIPKGEGKASYEIEVRNGPVQEVYLMGKISGIGGLNDD